MIDLKYKCMQCGICCHEVPGEYSKRIPVYPEEAERLIAIAKKKGVHFRVIEDLVFPDIKNKKILVVTYRIRLDNEDQCCPFYHEDVGCTVHNVKPLACQAYPLALKQEDAFNFKIDIDPLCNFVIENYDELTDSNMEDIKEIFPEEYKNAEAHLKKNKRIMIKVRELEYQKKIKILRKIKVEDFNKYLKDWDRKEIIIEDNNEDE
ncbi:MAG: YkgJ family cysteine cluster protein [Promethearchaeia archaeon]